ncbi:MAG: ATP-binding cassette domain-containing protein [Pseudomonadaceae bacterium]|nr:ATP-binding cassette domain-containing protein [Pseudomonadaceae bacterium]
MSLLRLDQACLAFGHTPILDHVELNVEARERLCVIGRNGTGKSTLLKVIAGEQALDSGVLWHADTTRIAKLAQEVPGTGESSLFDVIAEGLGDHSELLAKYHSASAALADGDATERQLAEFGQLTEALDAAGAWEGSQRVDEIITRLRLDPDARMNECSGGVRRRAMLGQALVSQPEVLVLDEPTNHLDIDAISELEEAVDGYAGTVIFVTHDRAFIDRLATRIVELDRGILRSYPGSYASYQKRKAEELAAEADAARKFDKDLANEEVWIRQGIKARRTRNEGRVRRLEAMRRERAQRRSRSGSVNMSIDSADRSGKLVAEAERAGVSYDGDVIIKPMDCRIQRGDRIGVIGANGSGKTTLLKMLLGELPPTTGQVQLGSKLDIAYFDQERAQLDLEATVIDNISEGSDQITVGGKTRHVISYLADFLFPPERSRSPAKTLSGGERNRLLLAKLFTKPANLLILDEPTNDLDVETLELLEELLGEFQGTLLLVSHDRSFIDRTVTSTLVLDGKGGVDEFVGGYSDWQRQRVSKASKPSAAGKVGDAKPKGSPAARAGATASNNHSARLSYKEQRELDALPARIEDLEAQVADAQQTIAEPEFYQGDQAGIDSMLKMLAELEAELAAAYARWEELDG